MRYLLLLAFLVGTLGAQDTPPLVIGSTGSTKQLSAGDRLVLPSGVAGRPVILAPGSQTAARVFSFPVTLGDDVIATLGTPAVFTAKVTLPAGTTSAASLTMMPGVAPTSPSNGDMWLTTAGLFYRANGSTVGPLAASGGGGNLSGTLTSSRIPYASGTSTVIDSAGLTFTDSTNRALTVSSSAGRGSVTIDGSTGADLKLAASGTTAYTLTGTAATLTLTDNANSTTPLSYTAGTASTGHLDLTNKLNLPPPTTARAPLNLPAGTAPTSPVDGDFWTTTAGAFVRVNGATVGPLGAAGGGSFVATGGTASISPADRAAFVLNVQDQGVVNDATTAGAGTDNATAMAAAITKANALYAASGNPVLLEGGNGCYALGSTVAMKSGVTLHGGTYVHRGASTATGALYSLFSASSLTSIGFDHVNGYGVGPDRKIAGSCTDSSTLGGRDSFADIDSSTDIAITGCRLYRFQNSLLISQSHQNRVDSNYINDLSSKTLAQLDAGTFTDYTFTGDPGGGIRFLGERGGTNQTESDGIACNGNVLIVVGLDQGIDCASQSGYPFRGSIDGNVVMGSNAGVQVYTSGAAVPDPGTLTTTSRGLSIKANLIVWTRQQGIYMRGVEGVSTVANHVERCDTLGSFVGSSGGGILNRTTTDHTYPTSPVAHDLFNIIEGNFVIDCGNPTTGVCDAGIRCDTRRSIVSNNVVARSLDRFGSNLTSASSYGICTVDVGGVAGVSDNPSSVSLLNNQVRGYNIGIQLSYVTSRSTAGGGFTVAIGENHVDTVVDGIKVNTLASGYLIDHNTVTHFTGTGIYVKNTPFTKITRNLTEGGTNGVNLASGSQASDYWQVGGRMGPTIVLNDNTFNGATTPILINETATGDVSVRGRCLECRNNTIDGTLFNRDSTGSFTFTAAPTASDYRIWHIGDRAPMRTPTGLAQEWVCTTAGAFGATIATTATTTNGSAVITFSALTAVVPDDYIAIAGVTGTKHVLSINVAANTATVDVVCDAGVSTAAITRPAPVFSNLVLPAQGGTGVANAGTITNASNTTITGGGTLALGGFTATVPATGTVGLLGTAQTWSALNTFSTAPALSGTTAHGVVLSQGASSVTATAPGTSGYVLTSTGTTTDPTWQPTSGGVTSVNTRTGAVTLVASDVPTMVASGASHAPGIVPDTPGSSGTVKYLREDATWAIPPNAGGGFPVVTGSYAVQDGTDITKQQLWDLASASTGTNLTLKGQQSTTQTLSFPNITTADTVATLKVANFFAPPAVSSTTYPTSFSYVSPAHTALSNGVVGTADVLFDLAAIHQWGGNTSVTNYKGLRITAPTLSSTTATTAFTTAATVCIEGPPIAGTNATASGAIALLINSGNMTLNAGTLTLKGAPSNAVITQSAASSGVAQSFLLTGGAHTNQTASTEVNDVTFNLARTVQHATGALTTNRSVIISGPTHGFVGASTLSEADTVAISAPAAGTNATITNANALRLTGQMLLDPQATTTSPQDGNLWADSTRNALNTRSKGLTTPLVGTIYTATASSTVANTTTPTTLIGSGVGTLTLPANYLVAGKTLKITVQGIISTTGLPNAQVQIKLGSTAVLDTTATATVGTLGNSYFQVSAIITCRTTGGSGTVISSGSFGYLGSSSQNVGMVVTSATTVDTTGSLTIDVPFTWGSASALDTVTGQIVTVQALN